MLFDLYNQKLNKLLFCIPVSPSFSICFKCYSCICMVSLLSEPMNTTVHTLLVTYIVGAFLYSRQWSKIGYIHICIYNYFCLKRLFKRMYYRSVDEDLKCCSTGCFPSSRTLEIRCKKRGTEWQVLKWWLYFSNMGLVIWVPITNLCPYSVVREKKIIDQICIVSLSCRTTNQYLDLFTLL